MTKNKLILPYILSDFLSATFVWFLFNRLRFREIAVFEGFGTLMDYFSFLPVWVGQILIPFFWLSIYYFSGYYSEPVGKSRVTEFFRTFASVLVGVLTLFFLVILNDLPRSFDVYYALFFYLFVLQFLCTYSPRLGITLYGISKIKTRQWARNVLIIGTGTKAEKVAEQLDHLGYEVVGFVAENTGGKIVIDANKLLGTMVDVSQLISHNNIHELIIAVETREGADLLALLYPLYRYRLPIKMLAESANVLSRTKINTLIGVPLVDLTDNHFSYAGENIKHFLDKVISIGVLVLFSPVFIYLVFRVKQDSPGPVFFLQERIGYMGNPFYIYKFRTMYEGAEEVDKPQLADEKDSRITPFGRFMRKYRLDELPQFLNVLKGDMSLVGPRPERAFFINQIVDSAPYYYLMQNIRPGITSLGMVKFGYARNVDEMIERLSYDMLYYENMSLLFDLKILVYTIKTVITGKGI